VDVTTPDPKQLPQDLWPLTEVNIADSSKVRVGDPVFLVGCPGDYEDYRLGLKETLNTGVISQINRGATVGNKYIADMLQFDAAANFGNSGSPLLNSNGDVIGVVIGGISPLLGEGINMAVASNMIIKIESIIGPVDESKIFPLVGPGYVYKYPWSGITAKDITPLHAWLGDNAAIGAEVKTVTPPASDAGIKAGDIITMIDGRLVTSSDEFYSFLAEYDVGDSVVLHVVRGTEELDITLELGEKP
jgi:S1-C subfamily serine protease